MEVIAVVQTAFIGDVVLATPLYEAARRAHPEARIIAVVRPGCANLIATNPYLNEVLIWDKHGGKRGLAGIWAMAHDLRQRGIGLALVPHRSIRTALAVRFAGIPERIGFNRGGGQWLHSLRVPYRRGVHEVERNLDLARAAGWDTEGCTPRIYPDEADRATVDNLLDTASRVAVLAPGSVWATKRWPAASYAAVGRALAGRGMQVVVSGGPDDAAVAGDVAGAIPGAINTAGSLTLRQAAELYGRAVVVITGDTAPQHLAAAMGAPVVAVFGPTVREFGFWPYTERGVLVEESLDCRPCNVHGPARCPRGTHDCMVRIAPERVLAAVDMLLTTGDAGSIG